MIVIAGGDHGSIFSAESWGREMGFFDQQAGK
jgi:hypothetical protein